MVLYYHVAFWCSWCRLPCPKDRESSYVYFTDFCIDDLRCLLRHSGVLVGPDGGQYMHTIEKSGI